jgi:hypothetical protein
MAVATDTMSRRETPIATPAIDAARGRGGGAKPALVCGLTFELTPTAEAGSVRLVRDDASKAADQPYAACRSGSALNEVLGHTLRRRDRAHWVRRARLCPWGGRLCASRSAQGLVCVQQRCKPPWPGCVPRCERRCMRRRLGGKEGCAARSRIFAAHGRDAAAEDRLTSPCWPNVRANPDRGGKHCKAGRRQCAEHLRPALQCLP